jgi:tetratricopeptide (TPR) repeat protein
LFEQAEYWRSRGQPDRVLAAVRRILLAVPDEPDALTLAIEAAAQTSSVDAAREFLERLRRVAPGNDQRTRRAEVSISVASTGGAALAEARRLAAAGRRPDAVRQYRELFRGNQAPPYLELEFYEVLAGTDENGYAEAIAGLRRIAASRPNDTQLSLKLATQLSYREGTRDEAIEMLQRLSRLPAAQAAARQQLRETYMWEPGSPGLATQIEELLQFLPGDRELEAKLAEARTSRRSAILIDAWELVNRNRIGEAERQFRQVLAETPDDPETMVSLAVIAARQGRVAEARALRVRAIALAPEREAEFMAYTTNIEGGTWRQPAPAVGGASPQGAEATPRRPACSHARRSSVARPIWRTSWRAAPRVAGGMMRPRARSCWGRSRCGVTIRRKPNAGSVLRSCSGPGTRKRPRGSTSPC